jgi:hypothetical protein
MFLDHMIISRPSVQYAIVIELGGKKPMAVIGSPSKHYSQDVVGQKNIHQVIWTQYPFA